MEKVSPNSELDKPKKCLTITLSPTAFKKLEEILANPPPATQALKDLMAGTEK